MAEVALHCFDVIACADGSHGVAVAQVVKTGIRATDGGNHALVLLQHRYSGQVAADLICEYQPGGILP